MGAGHDNDQGHDHRHGGSGQDHTAGTNALSLTIALAPTGTLLIAELVEA